MAILRLSRHRWLWFGSLLAAGLAAGCGASKHWQGDSVDAFGHFENRKADRKAEGVVVAVPHGSAEPGAIDYAEAIKQNTGAALVIAHRFKTNRIAVAQPVISHNRGTERSAGASRPSSVYPEYKKILLEAASDHLRFYVGIRIAEEPQPVPRIEIASGGFSFEQLAAMEQAYIKIRHRLSQSSDLPQVDIAISPWRAIAKEAFGEKNHGALMLAERGLIVWLPKRLVVPQYQLLYREIIANWVGEVAAIASWDSARMPTMQIQQLQFGRIDSSANGQQRRGMVIAAPHGSFDWYTAELVQELGYRTSLPVVMTRGFTPYECDGWRINVNQPTERRYPADTIERRTDRANEVYDQFKKKVLAAANGPLKLYIGMHQNGSQETIEVASLGITRARAAAIKSIYLAVRDRLLRQTPEVAKVNLKIEPLDQVEIGAWAAKDHGILRLAQSSLHFELPAGRILFHDRSRQIYTKILAELFGQIANTQDNVVADRSATTVPSL